MLHSSWSIATTSPRPQTLRQDGQHTRSRSEIEHPLSVQVHAHIDNNII